MLLDKPLQPDDVVTIKLITGEEIIARYEGQSDTTLSVSKASIVATNPKGGLGLMPWMMSALPEKIQMNMSTIVAYSPTVKEIADGFIESTSKIAIAK